jgi:hypothetical protein
MNTKAPNQRECITALRQREREILEPQRVRGSHPHSHPVFPPSLRDGLRLHSFVRFPSFVPSPVVRLPTRIRTVALTCMGQLTDGRGITAPSGAAVQAGCPRSAGGQTSECRECVGEVVRCLELGGGHQDTEPRKGTQPIQVPPSLCWVHEAPQDGPGTGRGLQKSAGRRVAGDEQEGRRPVGNRGHTRTTQAQGSLGTVGGKTRTCRRTHERAV